MKNSEKIVLELVPVGVRILTETDAISAEVPRFEGVSYCQAVLQSTLGRRHMVIPESIRICQWAPIALGFKGAENDFERSITPHLPPGTRAVYLAPVSAFGENEPPDVVIIRAGADAFRAMLEYLGEDSFVPHGGMGLDETALSVFSGGSLPRISRWAIRNVNRWLNWMNDFRWWQGFTTFLFRSTTVTRLFDRLISRTMANMSICRNSTVIPFQTGRANISFFCTGGIAWGRNFHDFMTSGFPRDLFRRLEERLIYPGLPGYTGRSARLDRLEKAVTGLDSQPAGPQ